MLRSGPGYAMYRARGDERRVILKLQRAGEAAVQRAAYARLDHPAIVPLLAAGSAEGLGYLAFDDHAGIGLDEYVRVTGPLDTARVVRIGVAAAEALGAASRVGIVHGDLGPERLLVCSSDARVELIDFLAPIADGLGAHAVHRAPEQRAGGPASPRADMYSLGVALHLAATGRPPVTLGLRAPLPGLPHALSAVIGLMLQAQPERRPASWAQVAGALQGARPRAQSGNDMSLGAGEEDAP
jgi:serine/threonine-protein kinase